MQRIETLLEKAQVFYDTGDPSHDLNHIRRVLDNCRRIGATVGADLAILLPAAILHDVVNLPKNHPERLAASRMAAEKSKNILIESGFSSFEIERIKEVITEHSYSLGKKPSSIESAVLQDSDKLDALGAIGIMRTVSCGVRMGSGYYDNIEPIAETRSLDDKKYTIDHFFTKLFKLPDLMNTEIAKREASERVAFMHIFLAQLKSEIAGTP
jgi:uncharacterized protein